MKKVLMAALALTLGASAFSQTYVYDDFSAAGSGTGFMAGSVWDDGISLTSASPLRPLTGQYATIGEFGESFRQLSAAAKSAIDTRTAGGNSFWVGFLARYTGPVGAGQQNYGGVQAREGGPGTGSAAKKFFMGSIWEKANWGAGTKCDNFDVESSAPIGAGADFLSYELNLSTHTGSMYVNNVHVLTGLELDDPANGRFFTTLSWLKIEAGSSQSQAISVDELRIGATSADVQPVPEPATLAVLGIGALALVRRRRK